MEVLERARNLFRRPVVAQSVGDVRGECGALRQETGFRPLGPAPSAILRVGGAISPDALVAGNLASNGGHRASQASADGPQGLVCRHAARNLFALLAG